MKGQWVREYRNFAARVFAYVRQSKCNADSPWGGGCGDCPFSVVHHTGPSCGVEYGQAWLKEQAERIEADEKGSTDE